MATYTISPLSAPTRSLNIASSANIANGTQVNIYATSGSNDQNWVVDSLTSTSRQYIKHFSNQAYALNAYRSGTNWNCTLYKASGNIDGYVILTKVANKTNVYTIRLSEYSNRYLTADGTGNSSKCSWRAATGGTEQQWKFTKVSTGGSGGSGTTDATDATKLQAEFQKVGDYDGVNGLQCVDIVRWYIDTYTTLKSTSGNGKDLVERLASNYGLSIDSVPKAPGIFSVAGSHKTWGCSGSAYGHTGIVVSVDTTKKTATVIHTGNSLTGKKPNSWVSPYSYPAEGVTFAYLGNYLK